MIERLLDYVEIRTKITSTFAFLYAAAYLFYSGQPVHWKLSLIFFAAMFLFDLATTAINNFIDSQNNAHAPHFRKKTAIAIIFMLVGVSSALGVYLVYLTDIVVLLLGGLCFLCGIVYTFGPLPISRQPWGEILSGVFYGFFIPFIFLYINMPAGTFLTLEWSRQTVSLELQVLPLFTAGILSVIPVLATANIMLANNICDLEHDIVMKRYTLPYYLGKAKALTLFVLIYYATYPPIIIMVILKIISPVCLVYLVSLIPVQRNIRQFLREQDKGRTFTVSIKNYVIIMGVSTALIFLGGLVK